MDLRSIGIKHGYIMKVKGQYSNQKSMELYVDIQRSHMENINYYDENTKKYIKRTFNVNMTLLADEFLSYIGEQGRLLDLGCGSGRDAIYFKEKGYDVYAMDGSKAMVDHVRGLLGGRVEWATFEDYQTTLTFDGIWACASLLHVSEEDMPKIVRKYRDLLNPEGIFFMSFKKGKEDYTYEGRSFICYEENRLRQMIEKVGGLEVLMIKETPSAKVDCEEEYWISALCKRKNIE